MSTRRCTDSAVTLRVTAIEPEHISGQATVRHFDELSEQAADTLLHIGETPTDTRISPMVAAELADIDLLKHDEYYRIDYQ